jgi:hypothetical protein
LNNCEREMPATKLHLAKWKRREASSVPPCCPGVESGVAENPSSEQAVKPRHRRHVKVVFDTNVVHNVSADHFVHTEVEELILDMPPDSDVQVGWHIPEVVRHERQYQMQKEALTVLPHVTKAERVLSQNLNVTGATLKQGVNDLIEKTCGTLGLILLPLDVTRVDLGRLILDAAYRRPPFQPGDKEKGFRDALIAESFIQLAEDSPSTTFCVLVTHDALLREALENRLTAEANVRLLADVAELKGFINTISAEIDEALRTAAGRLFFLKGDKNTLFYTQGIKQRINTDFKAELTAKPPFSTVRSNHGWKIASPNFVRKDGRRYFWATRVRVLAEAHMPALPNYVTSEPTLANPMLTNFPYLSPPQPAILRSDDIFEVSWSVDLNTSDEFVNPMIEGIKHAEVAWREMGHRERKVHLPRGGALSQAIRKRRNEEQA